MNIRKVVNLIFENILQYAKDDEEKERLKAFIDNPENQDFIEYIYLLGSGYDGWAELSSGKTQYVKQPMASPEQTGAALKKLSERLRETK